MPLLQLPPLLLLLLLILLPLKLLRPPPPPADAVPTRNGGSHATFHDRSACCSCLDYGRCRCGSYLGRGAAGRWDRC